MKTNHILFFVFLGMSIPFANAQSTVANATNTVTATNFLGSGTTSNFDVLFKRNAVNAGLLSTTKTSFGVNALAMPNSVSFGVSAGQFSSGLGSNTYVGQNAGKGTSATVLNSGAYNTFIGFGSGLPNRTGNYNTFYGTYSGGNNTSGTGNVAIGHFAGLGNDIGNYNTILGTGAGTEEVSSGSRNVFIGAAAGFSVSPGTSNNLVIGNDEYNQLIWGDFALSQIKFNGKVGIGGNALTYFGNYPTTAGGVNVAAYNLFVKGGILTEEVRVSLATTWADYVFANDYALKPLSEVETFINLNKHLPNVPSAKEVAANGIELGEMAKIQQEKIEELTLYLIQQNKEIEVLKSQMQLLLNKK